MRWQVQIGYTERLSPQQVKVEVKVKKPVIEADEKSASIIIVQSTSIT